MKYYIPEELNLNEIITAKPPQEVKKFSKQKLAIILSQIYYSFCTNRNNKDKDGYVALHSAILQRLVREYRQYLDYAVRAKIILEKRQFIEHKLCRRFKFAPTYGGKMKAYEGKTINTPAILYAIDSSNIELPKKYFFLKKHFINGELAINNTGVMDFVER